MKSSDTTARETSCKQDPESLYANACCSRFFTSQGGTVGEKHIFRVPTAAGADGIAPQCITCLMEGCKRADPSFAPGGTQFVLFCTAPYKHAVAYLKKTKNILESKLLLHKRLMLFAPGLMLLATEAHDPHS